MALPVPSNTSCDIYRNGNAPPAAPDVAGVPCYLTCDWRGGQEAGDRNSVNLTWTHVMLIEINVDLRDSYVGRGIFSQQDTVYLPDQSGTAFVVVFVERLQRGTAHEHKRVFLDRQQPTWPSNEL
jgi:hypothetical protein